MKHLSHPDLILCAMEEMALIDARPEKEQHLKECTSCSTLIHASAKQLQAYQAATRHECEAMSQLLIDHQVLTPTEPLPSNLKKHLEECYECRILAYQFQQFPTFEEFQAQNITYGDELFAGVEAQVMDAIKQWYRAPEPPYTEIIKQTIGDKFQEFIKILDVELYPIPIPSMVRGGTTNKYQIFSHHGGDLQLNTGIPNKKVKLVAIFNEKAYEETSDESGKVIFKYLLKDDYRVEIEGHEVKSIKEMIVGD